GATVYLLGGTDALSPAVESTIRSLGFKTVREAGIDRFATAVAIAHALGDPSTVLLASGLNFPDALSGGAAAAKVKAAILLTSDTAANPTTTTYLAAHPADIQWAVGGPAAAAYPAAKPLVGADRYATSVVVAQQFFSAPAAVGIASGLAFPDALSGGAVVGELGGPMLLTDPTTLSAPVQSYLAANKASIKQAIIFGGTSAVLPAVQSEVNAALA
ncbi:MAG TPA: cell wall-binding repeat-containing protein, partial [Acidimicrobiales bacterium]